MRKLLLLAAFAMAGLSLCFAEEFAGLSFEEELGTQAMQSIDGQFFRIVVPQNSRGVAAVTIHEKGETIKFNVPVTTVAVSLNPKNPPKDSSGKVYTPVPLASGRYNLGSTQQMSSSQFGSGIKVNTTVKTPYKDGSGSFKANDFFVHATPYGNTWGCVGVQSGSGATAKENMNRVMSAYLGSTGSKTVVVR
jgi:hypothetical protein